MIHDASKEDNAKSSSDEGGTTPLPQTVVRERRKSLAETTNQEQMKCNIEDMPKSLVKAKGFCFASLVETVDLVYSYCAALMNCSVDVPKDIGLWFDRS